MSLAVIICLAVAVIGMAMHAERGAAQGEVQLRVRVVELEAEVAALRSDVTYMQEEATDHERRLQEFERKGK